MLEVKVCRYEDVPEDYKENVPDNGAGKEYATYLIVKFDGKVVRVESDAMEPEDCTFGRDLSWIPDAIQDAYVAGVEDGKEEMEESL